MRLVLADTGPLYALTDPDDQYHGRSHSELARHGNRGARAPSQSRGQEQYRAGVHGSHRFDDSFGAQGIRHVDDDEPRLVFVAIGRGQLFQRIDDHDMSVFRQPALEQPENQVIRLHDEYGALLLHDDISDDPSVTNV